jgi:hypothetical protein
MLEETENSDVRGLVMALVSNQNPRPRGIGLRMTGSRIPTTSWIFAQLAQTD